MARNTGTQAMSMREEREGKNRCSKAWRLLENLAFYSASAHKEKMGKPQKSDPRMEMGAAETQRLTCFS